MSSASSTSSSSTAGLPRVTTSLAQPSSLSSNSPPCEFGFDQLSPRPSDYNNRGRHYVIQTANLTRAWKFAGSSKRAVAADKLNIITSLNSSQPFVRYRIHVVITLIILDRRFVIYWAQLLIEVYKTTPLAALSKHIYAASPQHILQFEVSNTDIGVCQLV